MDLRVTINGLTIGALMKRADIGSGLAIKHLPGYTPERFIASLKRSLRLHPSRFFLSIIVVRSCNQTIRLAALLLPLMAALKRSLCPLRSPPPSFIVLQGTVCRFPESLKSEGGVTIIRDGFGRLRSGWSVGNGAVSC